MYTCSCVPAVCRQTTKARRVRGCVRRRPTASAGAVRPPAEFRRRSRRCGTVHCGSPDGFCKTALPEHGWKKAGDQQLHGICSCAASDEPGRPCVGRDWRDRRGGGERRENPVLPLPRSGAHAKELPKEEARWTCLLLLRAARTCAERLSGEGGLVEQEGKNCSFEGIGASGSGTSDPCLLTTAQAKQRTALPRMYVEVHKTGMESEDWNRLVAVIDTGSTHTMVSSAHVERADISRSKESGDGLVALDGQPFAVIGCVNIRLRRLDGAARLPEISACAFVVQDLHVVNADVLIGADVVAGSNGLHLEYKENKICRIQFGPETPVVGSAADSHPIADALTRVPSKWLPRVKEKESPIAAGAGPVRPVTGALTLEQIKIAQKADPEICASVESLLKGDPLPGSFSRMKPQHMVDDGLLCRSVKLPVDGEVVVPVIPATLEQQALRDQRNGS